MKQKIILDLDFNQGAIWTSDQETGKPFTGIDIIDNNKEIAKLNKEISDIYTSYYELDSHDVPCWFNEEKKEMEKAKLLELVGELKLLLNSINDGSFEIEDRIQSLY